MITKANNKHNRRSAEEVVAHIYIYIYALYYYYCYYYLKDIYLFIYSYISLSIYIYITHIYIWQIYIVVRRPMIDLLHTFIILTFFTMFDLLKTYIRNFKIEIIFPADHVPI